jgi:hypothetical protein
MEYGLHQWNRCKPYLYLWPLNNHPDQHYRYLIILFSRVGSRGFVTWKLLINAFACYELTALILSPASADLPQAS